MIVSIVMPFYPNATLFFLVLYQGTLNHCSYYKYENQPRNSLIKPDNQKNNSSLQFTSLLIEHFDVTWRAHDASLEFACVVGMRRTNYSVNVL